MNSGKEWDISQLIMTTTIKKRKSLVSFLVQRGSKVKREKEIQEA